MKKTVLYEEHLKHGAKIVEFGGFLMPIEYTSISREHQAVRERCGMFDVSHMGEIRITGKDTTAYVNHMITNDIRLHGNMRMIYGLLLYENGGVVDDLMVYKYHDNHVLLVVNASNTDKDFDWLVTHKDGFDVEIVNESERFGQIALQGPFALSVIQNLTDYPLNSMTLFDFSDMSINGSKCIVSRSGYTGEDGFEIYGSNEDILKLFRLLAMLPEVSLCGLGCRDTLRFEAAMPLYGHEISETINPLEAGLNFGVRLDKEFIGRDALLKQQEEGLKRKIVGLELVERGIARGGYEIEAGGEIIGTVTTGYMIPNTEVSIAFALIDSRYAKIGTEVYVHIRKNKVLAKVR
jgi:aminomethyltransferase